MARAREHQNAVPDAGQLLSFPMLEQRSNISRHTWRLWVKQKKLPAVHLGRRRLVHERDYEKFVAANRW
jgi:excisionase family DNA binding protein